MAGRFYYRGRSKLFMRRIELYEQTTTLQEVISYCRIHGLLAPQARCQICGSDMKEVADNGDDGVIWTCRNATAAGRHRSKTSIRNHSFFSGSRLSIKQQVYMIYEWAVKTGVGEVAYQLDVSEKVTIKMFARLRQIAGQATRTAGPCVIGGEGALIEIDECQVGRRKHHRGRVPRELWVFGAVERGSNPFKGFIEVVAKRDKTTLEEIITRRIDCRSTIVSDGWRGYTGLREKGFNHKVVNHSENFVHPLDSSVHTQNVENMWRCFRRFLNAKGTYTRRHILGYIDEFIFRKSCIDPFETILSEIERQYPTLV